MILIKVLYLTWNFVVHAKIPICSLLIWVSIKMWDLKKKKIESFVKAWLEVCKYFAKFILVILISPLSWPLNEYLSFPTTSNSLAHCLKEKSCSLELKRIIDKRGLYWIKNYSSLYPSFTGFVLCIFKYSSNKK